MKSTEKPHWRKRVAWVARLRVAETTDVEPGHSQIDTEVDADLIRRKETRTLVPRVRLAECKLDGRTMNVRRFDRTEAVTRQVAQWSGPVPIAKLVPTLP